MSNGNSGIFIYLCSGSACRNWLSGEMYSSFKDTDQGYLKEWKSRSRVSPRRRHEASTLPNSQLRVLFPEKFWDNIDITVAGEIQGVVILG